MNFELMQRRFEMWIRDQRSKIPSPPSLPRVSWPRVKWPPWPDDHQQQRKKLQEEYERRRKQLDDLCKAIKAESVADLQDIICCMVLSECVYKRPATELVRAVNKFKADFGGKIVSLERVQPSLDHVPHRYLLAEAGDTLFASFVGTKQYKDVMTDANIFQGAIFHDDALDGCEVMDGAQTDIIDSQCGNIPKTLETRTKQLRAKLKPAAHRGFMARAKGIPAIELYRLAQKKKKKLVLCGHSLGGAVAALATLAILRVVAASAPKENDKLQVKCITFSQPPVGNASLRDYVIRKGWQHYFKSYCIPEDLVPRLLSPAYFHHYNAQSSVRLVNGSSFGSSVSKRGEIVEILKSEKSKDNGEEQLVLGVGPVQTSFWRLSRLVPIEGVRRHLMKFKDNQVSSNSMTDSNVDVNEPQTLEIQEDSDGVSLRPISHTDDGESDAMTKIKKPAKTGKNGGDSAAWHRVPYLPSYVPFGELYLLGTSSIELLSDAEYSKLTSVKSVVAELRERLQSHSMKSYRSRFQRIYDLCMNDHNSSFLGMEQLQQFPHLHQCLGLSVAGNVELGFIVESPSIRTATSLAPLGWAGVPGDKNAEPLKVDLTGFGLHLCTLIQAQVNGNWCSTTVESFPSTPTYSSDGMLQPEQQKMRVIIGAPLRHSLKHHIVLDSLLNLLPVDSESRNLKEQINGAFSETKFIRPGGLGSFVIYCTSDFATASKAVDLRTRRVRLVGLEGAGKSTLLKAILSQPRKGTRIGGEDPLPEPEVQEGIFGGLCYMDSVGVNLQELNVEVSRVRDELRSGMRDISKRIDLIVLVHNLAHGITWHNGNANNSACERHPALSAIVNEAKALGIPWILAVTNKFSVSAHQQRGAVEAVLQAYRTSPSTTVIVNSCPYVMHMGGGNSFAAVNEECASPSNLIMGSLNIVRRSFQRKANVLPVEGVSSLCQMVHRVLHTHEESSFQELARDRLLLELERDRAAEEKAARDAREKANSMSAAAVGASLGAGLGIVLAVVMGAASALRKPP